MFFRGIVGTRRYEMHLTLKDYNFSVNIFSAPFHLANQSTRCLQRLQRTYLLWGRKWSRKRHGMRQCVLRHGWGPRLWVRETESGVRRQGSHRVGSTWHDHCTGAGGPSARAGTTRPLHSAHTTTALHWTCRLSTDKPERHDMRTVVRKALETACLSVRKCA